ncbi:unnamed protein product [Effrenium voratum]|uniref:Uncharacterized protein n=1 Tax=Effrenium voratum TaxID=2562239 RepID=A0AA36HY48_9DINO|nr:unnamed protein product [Effrenium voratum]
MSWRWCLPLSTLPSKWPPPHEWRTVSVASDAKLPAPLTSSASVSTCRRMRRHSTALPVADIVFRNSANHKLNGLQALRPYVGMGRIIKRTSWGSTRN